MKLKLSLLALLVFSGATFAEIKTPGIFSDNMLLQRDMPVKIWGTSGPNAKIEVSFSGQKKSAKADANGDWNVFLDAMKANKNLQEMKISENGKESKVVKNILVGEVWILGGQSNMQWGIGNTPEFEDFKSRAYPQIRYFNQVTYHAAETPQKDSLWGKWLEISPQTEYLEHFSAVGLYFAKHLSKDLDIPVGVVFTALGGSAMIAWTPEDKMQTLPYYASELKKFKESMKTYDYDGAMKKWKADYADWEKEVEKAKKENRKPNPEWAPPEPLKFSSRAITETPAYLYNAVVAPIAGLSARGVLWYQGESDSWGERLENFEAQYATMTNAWREKFGNDKLYFLSTQLTSYGAGDEFVEAREKQLMVSKVIKHSSIVNTIDLGEQYDVHPRDKHRVAQRAGKLALRDCYGMKKVFGRSPEMVKVDYAQSSATISFENEGGKLVAKGEPRGFEIMSGGKWIPAAASLQGTKVVVKSSNNEKIEGVRYLWKGFAKPNVWLYSQDGVPAFPFKNIKE